MATLLAGTRVYVKDDEKGFVQAEVKAVSGGKVRRREKQEKNLREVKGRKAELRRELKRTRSRNLETEEWKHDGAPTIHVL